MWILLLTLLMAGVVDADPLKPILSNTECKYKKVAALTTDTAGGFTVPNGETHAVHRFTGVGAEPSAFTYIVWDRGGGGEKVFISTKGEVDVYFDASNSQFQVTGDGVKKLEIVIENSLATMSPYIGGCLETIKL